MTVPHKTDDGIQPAVKKKLLSQTTSADTAAKAGNTVWLTTWRSWLPWVIILIATFALPSVFDMLFGFSAGFQIHRVSLIGIFVLAAFAQNILTGYAAQPSLGNAAFFGVSGYMLVWLVNDLKQSYIVGLAFAILFSALLGVIVGGPALRVSGAYLAIASLGLVLLTGSILDLWDTTAGRQNYDFTNIPAILNDDHSLYYVIFLTLAVILLLGYWLIRSRVGRALIAIRDNELAAEAFGINLTRYKLLAFVLSATLTGLAGGFYATWATTASSSMSSVDQTIAFLAMIVIGGVGSIVGSIFGAIFVGFLPLLLGQLPNVISIGPVQIQIATLNSGIYGLLLLLTLIYFPYGLQVIPARIQNIIRQLQNIRSKREVAS